MTFYQQNIDVLHRKTISLNEWKNILSSYDERNFLHGIENNAVSLFLRNNPEYSGRLFGRNSRQCGSMLCYELYAEMCVGLNTDGFETSGEFDGYDTSCAQIRVKNSDNEISAAWDYLYAEWLPKSMFEYAGRNNNIYENQYFEEYIYKNSCPMQLKLFLPLVRKSGCLKIAIENKRSMLFLVSAKNSFNAEKEASRAVINYLKQNYPYVVRSAKEFFYRQLGGDCTCGVRINARIEAYEDLQIISFTNQSFAVLYFSGISGYEQSCKILTNWLCENGIDRDGDPFAVYDPSDSYENPSMKLFCPVKNVRI